MSVKTQPCEPLPHFLFKKKKVKYVLQSKNIYLF